MINIALDFIFIFRYGAKIVNSTYVEDIQTAAQSGKCSPSEN